MTVLFHGRPSDLEIIFAAKQTFSCKSHTYVCNLKSHGCVFTAVKQDLAGVIYWMTERL